MSVKTVVLNGERVNFDGNISYDGLTDEVIVYEATPEELIIERVADAMIVVTKEMPMPGHIIRALPDSVRLICEAGTGYNNIDLAAAKEKGITVCNVAGYSTQRVAHTVIAMITCLSSMIQKQVRMLERGDHSNFTKCLQVPHTEVNGKTLGVIGAGTIGREVIKIAKVLGMNVLAYDKFPGKDEEGVRYTDVAEVIKNADYLTLHCPLTEETHHIINEETLATMKPTAFVINTARGALVDEPAIIKALQTGVIAGAALDVQETEPPAAENPLYDMDNVLLTPHMGWKGYETRQRLVSILKQNIDAYLSGSPINVIV